jgi:hypothetical protein
MLIVPSESLKAQNQNIAISISHYSLETQKAKQPAENK